MSGPFILQREVREGSRAFWFDSRSFDTIERARDCLRYEQASQQLAISGAGGSNWSGKRVQNMRIVKAIPALAQAQAQLGES